MNRSEKAAIIEQLKSRIEAAPFAVVTDFKGMTVEELTSLRVKLREAGGEIYVVKNTLARLAFTDGQHDSVKDMFKENSAVALGFEDPVAVAKALSDLPSQASFSSCVTAASRARLFPPPRSKILRNCPAGKCSLPRYLAL